MTFFIDLDDTIFDCGTLKKQAVQKISEHIKPISEFNEVNDFSGEEKVHAEQLLLKEIKNIKPYPNMISWIENNQPAFLITHGTNERQEAKISALGIQSMFKEIIITQDKKEAFNYLVDKYALDPVKVLVVGDKSHEELRIGEELGMNIQLVKNGDFL